MTENFQNPFAFTVLKATDEQQLKRFFGKTYDKMIETETTYKLKTDGKKVLVTKNCVNCKFIKTADEFKEANDKAIERCRRLGGFATNANMQTKSVLSLTEGDNMKTPCRNCKLRSPATAYARNTNDTKKNLRK